MLKNKIILVFLILPFFTIAQNEYVFKVNFVKNKITSLEVNLSEGVFLDDLSWAWNSQNACFPETQKSKFTGKHLFFTGILSEKSKATITVIPKNKRKNLSLYAYQMPLNDTFLVPNLPHCIACEADHKNDYKKYGKPKQNHKRKVSNFIALDNSYRIVIGVTGADNLSVAEFILEIKTEEL